jgi:hypothetical protein
MMKSIAKKILFIFILIIIFYFSLILGIFLSAYLVIKIGIYENLYFPLIGLFTAVFSGCLVKAILFNEIHFIINKD